MSNFNFGFAQEDITPKYGLPLSGYFNPRPNKGALDRLFLKASIFECNGEITGIVSYDLCMVGHDLVERFIDGLKKAGANYAEKILFCATHTHTGPYTKALFGNNCDAKYLQELVDKTVIAVKNAYESLSAAELLSTTTTCDTLAYNRRYWMKNDTVLANPGKLNPNIVKPEGPIDADIPILAVKKDGIYQLLIANIVNHTDTIGGDYVSADWPGKMEKEIQSELGYDVPVMTIIGCQGNINHFNVKTAFDQTSYAEATRIGKAYGAVILSSLYQLLPVEFNSIKVDVTEIEIPYMEVSDEVYNEAKMLVEKHKDAVMEDGRDFTSEDIAKEHPFVVKFFAQRVIDCRDKKPTSPAIEWMISLKFGDKIGIVSVPCEPFVEIGLAIKAASKFPLTIVAGLGMGTNGYIGLEDNYQPCKSKAYETCPDTGKASSTAGQKLIEYGSKLINL